MSHPIRKQPVMHPEDMNRSFSDAYNSGNIANLLALYEENAILVSDAGEPRQGIDSIREMLDGLLLLGGTMVSTNQYCYQFEDIALLRAYFILSTVGTDGQPLVIQGHTAEVVRKQPDGSWLYVIDHPFGAQPIISEA